MSNWDNFRQHLQREGVREVNISECSKNDKKVKLLGSSRFEGYDFDILTRDFLFKNTSKHDLPKSADCLIIRDNLVIFIEFKAGFFDKVSKATWKDNDLFCDRCRENRTHVHSSCNQCDIYCEKCKKAIFTV